MHQQMDFVVYRNCHFRGHNVVFRVLVVGQIKAKKVRIRLADQRGMERAKLPVRTGIAEVKRKLPGLNLNRHGVSSRGCEIYTRPGPGTKYSKGQDFSAHQKKSRDHQALGAARKFSDLRVLWPVGKLPDKKRQNKLRRQKRDSRLRHGLRHLFVNQMSVN
jgi:hypothetical protein